MPISTQEFQNGHTNERTGSALGLWLRGYLSNNPHLAFTADELRKACPHMAPIASPFEKAARNMEVFHALKSLMLAHLVEFREVERGDGNYDQYYHWKGGVADAH